MKLFANLKWFFKKEWKQYTGSIILLIIISFLQLIPPKIVNIIIDSSFYKKKSSNNLIYNIILMILISLLIYILRYFWRILLFGSSYKLAIYLRYKIYNSLSNQFPQFYLKNKTGDLMARVTNDVDKVVFAAGEGVLTLVDSIIMGFSVISTMSQQVSWKLTMISLIPMPIMSILIQKNGQKLHYYFQKSQNAFSSLNNIVQENLTNIRMIKSFGLEHYQLNKFLIKTINTSKKNIKVSKIYARFEPIIYLIIGLSNLFAIILGSYFVIYNYMTLGELTSFIMYLSLIVWPMIALAWMFNILERGSAAYNRINKILNKKIDITNGTINVPKKPCLLKINIKYFFYPNTTYKVLKNIKINLYPKKILGICGSIGSGKTTLISLILRNFNITKGEIYYNNIPLSNLILNQWRKKIALIEQTPFLFSDNIFNNISFGKPNSNINTIKKVAKLACIHEDILNLPQGYYTEIGEKGIMLSGGQKQRIAIARALLLNSEIIILDDALSAVDAYTEYKILKNLQKLEKKHTLIIISHKLSALYNANQIIVLNNGTIIQLGNHNNLIKQKGWYKNMFYYQNLEKKI